MIEDLTNFDTLLWGIFLSGVLAMIMFFLSTRPDRIRRRKYIHFLLSWLNACANRTHRLRPDNQYRASDLDWFLRSFESNYKSFFYHTDLFDYNFISSNEVVMNIIKAELPFFIKRFNEDNLKILQIHYIGMIKSIQRAYPREYLSHRLKTENEYLKSNWKIGNLFECKFY